MAKFEPSEAVIQLGKELVVALRIDGQHQERDPLGRWLAHDLAQKIEAAERLKGADGEAARETCTAAILNLWDHRASFPLRQRPLGGVEAALRLLERLDHERHQTLYFPAPRPSRQTDEWLDTALAIDRAARVLLRACARFAVEHDGGRTSNFVKLAENAGLDDALDIEFVRVLLTRDQDDGLPDRSSARRAKELDAVKVFSKSIKRLRAAIADEAAAPKPKTALSSQALGARSTVPPPRLDTRPASAHSTRKSKLGRSSKAH